MSQRVLVIGGTGVPGRQVVDKLTRAGYMVRVMSRRPQPKTPMPGIEWAPADLVTGRGLAEAVADVHVIVHAASSVLVHNREVDVEGTRHLIELAGAAQVSHWMYISIVGIERVPFAYYRNKVAAENIVTASDVPWSILRATQFHDLIDAFVQPIAWFPLAFLPADFQFQPIDSGEVADELVKCVAAGPSGRLPDMGGPEIHRLGDLARVWLKARGLRRLIVRLRIPGHVAHAFRSGYVTTPQNRQGRITWAEWVHRKYGVNES